jgi:catechol 2,3-dioxygenase-like lactoylglutathione lyase family enzyme
MVRIRHVAVVVSDADKMAAFYEDVLGFKKIGGRTPNHFPGQAIDLGDTEVQLSLLQRHDAANQPWSTNNLGPNHIGVEVDNANEVASRLGRYGIELIGPRYAKDDPSALRYFKFRDPEGTEVDVSAAPHVWSVG